MNPVCAKSVRYPLQSRQELVALYENWWDKFHTTAREITAEREGSEETAGELPPGVRIWCVR